MVRDTNHSQVVFHSVVLTISHVVPNKIVGSHFGDFRLWQTVALKNLTSSMKSTIAFSFSGEWLAIPDGKYATLWNTSNRTAIRTSRDQGENIQDENENIQVAAFSPNSIYLATGGTRLIIWEVATGLNFSHKYFNVGQNVQYIAFSPDNTLVACSSASKVGVWNIQSGKKLFKFSHPNSRAVPLIFASVGTRLIYCPSYDGRMWTQDLTTGEFFISSASSMRLQLSSILGVVPNFSLDGRYLAASDGSRIFVLDTTKKTPEVSPPTVRTKLFGLIHRELRPCEVHVATEEYPNHWFNIELNCERIGNLAFSPNGKVLATCMHPKENVSIWKIVLWDIVESKNGTFKLENFRTIGEFHRDIRSDNQHMAFSPDGMFLACSSISNRMVRLWKADI